MPKYLLGIDNGGTVAKAGLFTTEGRELAVAARKSDMDSPRPGWVERDMERLWQATAESIRAVLAEAKIDPRDIAGIACAGHGNGIYLVDERGCPVRPGIGSPDVRAREYIDRWKAAGVHQAVLPKTMQSLWPGQPNALLAWLRDNEPETMKRARWVLMCKDYIRFRLTGQIDSELTDASGTSLMDVGTGQYDMGVLEAFGLADMRRLLPPVRRSEEVCGTVTSQAAAETGLAEGIPVAGGLFDIDASALASGLVDESQMGLTVGTWSISQYVSATPIVDENIFMTSRYCIPGHYLMLEASPTSASNLEWFVTQFFQSERAALQGQDKSVYDLCNDLVATVKPEDVGIVFLPFLFASNAHPDAKAAFVGLTGWHERGHVLRAIYEGVAFGHHTHVDRLMRFRNLPETIRLTGGAARSQVWVQLFADVFQTPIEIPAGTELGALGCAICASVAAGIYPDYHRAAEAMVNVARVQKPNNALGTLYAKKYERYQKVLAALGPVWGELQDSLKS